MSTYYTVKAPNGVVAYKANTLTAALRAAHILGRRLGIKLTVYGPEHQTHQRALDILR